MKSKTLTFLFSIAMLLLWSCNDEPFDADSGTFVDSRDNHEYQWVKIGEQIWMAENLAYIPDDVCELDSQCGTWIYDYSGEGSYGVNYQIYGCLYDWETAQQVCPEGWHLPSDEEWMELERHLGMEEIELDRFACRGEIELNIGGELASTNTDFWDESWIRSNETGFTAIPSGARDIRYTKGEFYFLGLGSSAYYWTDTAYDEEQALFRTIVNFGCIDRMIEYKESGFAIRCIKD